MSGQCRNALDQCRSLEGVHQGQRLPRQALPQTQSQGVLEGGGPHDKRVHSDGIRQRSGVETLHDVLGMPHSATVQAHDKF